MLEKTRLCVDSLWAIIHRIAGAVCGVHLVACYGFPHAICVSGCADQSAYQRRFQKPLRACHASKQVKLQSQIQ